jgi:hypothetical protein
MRIYALVVTLIFKLLSGGKISYFRYNSILITKLGVCNEETIQALIWTFSVFNEVFVGIQRYEIPAVITGVGKLTSGILIIIAAKMSNSYV